MGRRRARAHGRRTRRTAAADAARCGLVVQQRRVLHRRPHHRGRDRKDLRDGAPRSRARPARDRARVLLDGGRDHPPLRRRARARRGEGDRCRAAVADRTVRARRGRPGHDRSRAAALRTFLDRGRRLPLARVGCGDDTPADRGRRDHRCGRARVDADLGRGRSADRARRRDKGADLVAGHRARPWLRARDRHEPQLRRHPRRPRGGGRLRGVPGRPEPRARSGRARPGAVRRPLRGAHGGCRARADGRGARAPLHPQGRVSHAETPPMPPPPPATMRFASADLLFAVDDTWKGEKVGSCATRTAGSRGCASGDASSSPSRASRCTTSRNDDRSGVDALDLALASDAPSARVAGRIAGWGRRASSSLRCRRSCSPARPGR